MSQPLSLKNGKPGFTFGTHDAEGGSSQRSSLFPWDNAGFASSSSGLLRRGGSEDVVADKAEVRLRGSSLSRRESSLVPSHAGSGGIGLSPARLPKNSDVIEDDFAFDGK